MPRLVKKADVQAYQEQPLQSGEVESASHPKPHLSKDMVGGRSIFELELAASEWLNFCCVRVLLFCCLRVLLSACVGVLLFCCVRVLLSAEEGSAKDSLAQNQFSGVTTSGSRGGWGEPGLRSVSSRAVEHVRYLGMCSWAASEAWRAVADEGRAKWASATSVG